MDAFKVYTADVRALLHEDQTSNASGERKWSEAAERILNVEDELLNFVSQQVNVNPSYTSVPCEDILEEAAKYAPSFLDSLVGSQQVSENEPKGWTSQIPKHCFSLWVDVLSIILTIDQGRATRLLIDVAQQKQTIPDLRKSVVLTLEQLVSPSASLQESLFPVKFLADCIETFHRQRTYHLKCLVSVMSRVSDSVFQSSLIEDVDNQRLILELRSLGIRWVQKGLIPRAARELMSVMEELREHVKMRDSLQQRIALYEANLARVGQALTGGMPSQCPLAVTDLTGFFRVTHAACLQRVKDLVCLLLAACSSCHLSKKSDFACLANLCPNIVMYRTWDANDPLENVEPERGISVTEYDLFVEQNAVDKHFYTELFELTPYMAHVLVATLDMDLARLRSDIVIDSAPARPEEVRPVVATRAPDYLKPSNSIKMLSSENRWGQVVQWMVGGLRPDYVEESQDCDEIFSLGCTDWEVCTQLMESFLRCGDPIQPLEGLILKLYARAFRPFYLRHSCAVPALAVTEVNGTIKNLVDFLNKLDERDKRPVVRVLTARPPSPPAPDPIRARIGSFGGFGARGISGLNPSSPRGHTGVPSARLNNIESFSNVPDRAAQTESRPNGLGHTAPDQGWHLVPPVLEGDGVPGSSHNEQQGEAATLPNAQNEPPVLPQVAATEPIADFPSPTGPGQVQETRFERALSKIDSMPLSGRRQVIAPVLMMLDALLRRLPVLAPLIMDVVLQVAELWPYKNPPPPAVTSGWATALSLPGRLLGPVMLMSRNPQPYPSERDQEDPRRLASMAAIAHLAATTMYFLTEAEVKSFAEVFLTPHGPLGGIPHENISRQVVFAEAGVGDLAKTLTWNGRADPTTSISVFDGYLRCLAAAAVVSHLSDLLTPSGEVGDDCWVSNNETKTMALNILGTDSNALSQKLGINFGAMSPANGESMQEARVRWVVGLTSLKSAALSTLATFMTDTCGDGVVRQFLQRLAHMRLDIYIIQENAVHMSPAEVRTLRSSYLCATLYCFRRLMLGAEFSQVLFELVSIRTGYIGMARNPYQHNAERGMIPGWQQLFRFVEGEILLWLCNPLVYSLSCWRLVSLLCQFITSVLSADSMDSALWTEPQVYLASHLLSDTSPWFQVLYVSMRRACRMLRGDVLMEPWEERVVRSTFEAGVATMYHLLFREDKFRSMWEALPVDRKDRSRGEKGRVDRIFVDVLPGLRSLAVPLCRKGDDFTWTVESDNTMPLIIFLAEQMAVRCDSNLARTALLPIFCTVALRCKDEVSRALQENPSVCEQVQTLVAKWLSDESAQVVEGLDLEKGSWLTKVCTPFEKLESPASLHNNRTSRWGNEPIQRKERSAGIWRLFQQNVMAPVALHGTFEETVVEHLDLPPRVPEPHTATVMARKWNEAAGRLICDHLTRHTPALTDKPPFVEREDASRRAPRRQLLDFFAQSLQPKPSDQVQSYPPKVQEITPGEVLLGMISSSQSIILREVAHVAAGRRFPSVEAAREEWDVTPPCIRVLRTLFSLAQIEVPELRKRLIPPVQVENTATLTETLSIPVTQSRPVPNLAKKLKQHHAAKELEQFTTLLAPIIEESIYAAECLAALYKKGAIRPILLTIAPKRDNDIRQVLCPNIQNEDTTAISSCLLDWYGSQCQLLQAEFNARLVGLDDDFECGLCLSQKARRRKWAESADARIKADQAMAIKLARSFSKKADADDSLPAYLSAIDRCLSIMFTNFRKYTTMPDGDSEPPPAIPATAADIVYDFQESAFGLYIAASKIVLESIRQSLVQDPMTQLRQFREDFVSPVDSRMRQILKEDINITREGLVRTNLSIGWALLWCDMIQLLLQRSLFVIKENSTTGDLSSSPPISRASVVEICIMACEAGRLTRHSNDFVICHTQFTSSAPTEPPLRHGERLTATLECLIYTALEYDRYVILREIKDSSITTDSLDAGIWDLPNYRSPIMSIVAKSTPTQNPVPLCVTFLNWGEAILKCLQTTDGTVLGHWGNLRRSRLMCALSLVNGVLSTIYILNEPDIQTYRGILVGHGRVITKILELAVKLRPSDLLRAKQLIFRGHMLMLASCGVDGWVLNRSIVEHQFSWHEYLSPVELKPDTSVIIMGEEKFRCLQSVFRSLYIILHPSALPVQLDFQAVLEDISLGAFQKQLVYALAQSDWLWVLEISAWRLLHETLAYFSNHTTQKAERHEMDENQVLNDPVASGLAEFREASRWKAVEDALQEAISHEESELPNHRRGPKPPVRPKMSGGFRGNAAPKAETAALKTLLDAATWYVLVVHQLLAVLLGPEDVQADRLVHRPRIQGSEIFDRLSALLKLVTSVRNEQYRAMAARGNDFSGPVPVHWLESGLDVRLDCLDDTEISRQQLTIIILRCLKLEPQLLNHLPVV